MLAIVKPDHLGDLVLSKPAISALLTLAEPTTLFVGSAVAPLAENLFPSIDIRAIDLPHLSKRTDGLANIGRLGEELAGFSRVAFLRDDGVMRQLAGACTGSVTIASGSHLEHESWIQKRSLAQVVTYSRTAQFAARRTELLSRPAKVGLCIAAGFPTNRWPLLHWIELAARLMRDGVDVRVIGGPGERDDIGFLVRNAGLRADAAIIGSHDFNEFWAHIDELDAVVASDGGTAHLCSLRVPVISIFTSSPWRRYAPFGRNNLLLTRDLACSPCMQFSQEHVNGCPTRECGTWILPKDVHSVLGGFGGGQSSPLGRAHLFRGSSHMISGAH